MDYQYILNVSLLQHLDYHNYNIPIKTSKYNTHFIILYEREIEKNNDTEIKKKKSYQ